jgi:hypothetical protein
MGVGLAWTRRPGGYVWDGRDTTGRFYAHVSRLTGAWIVYVTRWGCGPEGGLSFGRFDSEDEAMDASV